MELPPAIRGSETVLLVEDDEALRELIHEFLETSGYEVLVASDPARAIEAARGREGAIHLLLTDISMPSMNGGELARRVKELRPEIRVLYMSGYSADGMGDRGVPEPGALLILKPFSQEALARKLREALGPHPSPGG